MAATRPDVSARRALEKLLLKQEELEELKRSSGIVKLEKEVSALKVKITNSMIEGDMDQVQGTGYHATLIRAGYDARVVGTEDDLQPGDPPEVVPLREIIYRKFKHDKNLARRTWFACTRRVVVIDMLEEQVAGGVLTVDEIAEAYVQKEKKPYIRIFKDKL